MAIQAEYVWDNSFKEFLYGKVLKLNLNIFDWNKIKAEKQILWNQQSKMIPKRDFWLNNQFGIGAPQVRNW